MIVSFEGAIINIPSGWVLCDGNNGTPDLRNRFIVGAGDTYNPGITSGAINHTHSFTGDGHFHDIAIGSGLGAGAGIGPVTDTGVSGGITNAGSSLPPYYALAYIMKT